MEIMDSLDFSKIVSQTINNASIFYSTSPKLTYFCMFSFMYFVYYIKEVVKSSTLICNNQKFKKFLIENCAEVIEKPYYPTFWAFGTFAQTILANLIRGYLPKLKYEREIIKMPDNGEVSLDWYNDDNLKTSNKPIVILMPGLVGDSQTEYIVSLVPVVHSIGVRCCVLNNRGRGGMALKTCRLYCASNCEDVEFTLNHIKSKYPNSKLIAVGISLGGIVLGRYLTQTGERAVVDAAMLISVCFDFFAGCTSLESGSLNLALNRHLSRTLKAILIDHRPVLEQNTNLDYEAILKCKTLKEFDELFTCKMWGYQKVEDYYRDASLKDKLHLIKKPTLCLNSADDIFCPGQALPIEQFKNSTHTALLLTKKGGHIGFMDAQIGMVPFFSERLCKKYISSLITLDNIEETLG